ncbi:hypothetical protein [Flavobacterium frigidimaris]|nr:hypothetical protein [Flavobacterium frigidimaris]
MSHQKDHITKRKVEMTKFNFNNKRFAVIQNSDNGQVNTETIFKYKQEDNLVTADYFGGTIKYGKIIADLKEDKLHMLYQCLTVDNELKAGKALAKITLSESGKIKLSLDWEWLTNGNDKGRSEYIEIE